MSNDQYRYLATKWRKSLERRGWHNIRKGVAIKRVLSSTSYIRVSFTVVAARSCTLTPKIPTTLARLLFLFRRTDQITEGVWRLPRNQNAELGWVIRGFDFGGSLT